MVINIFQNKYQNNFDNFGDPNNYLKLEFLWFQWSDDFQDFQSLY